MDIRPIVVIVVAPIVACASSSGGGGLGALRKELGLMPSRGHVERDGRVAWVVDDVLGAQLVAIEPDDATCGDAPDASATWRLYEGSPHGAALAFTGEGATLWWYDGVAACAMAQRVFTSPAPDDEALLGSAQSSFGDEDGEAADAPIQTFEVAPDGQPRVEARLSPDDIEIVGASGEVILRESGHVSTACSGSVDAGLWRAVRGDGSVLLGFSQSVSAVQAADGGGGCQSEDIFVETSNLELWIAVDARAQAAEVIYRKSRYEGDESSDDVYFTVGLPIGAIVHEHNERTYSSRNVADETTVSWSWKFRPAQGDPVTLASTPSY